MKSLWALVAWALAFAVNAQTDAPGDAAAGRMLYRDTPLLRGSLQACVQCHANPLNQRRGLSLAEQQDHIRCAIQGGCGGAVLAVYPYGAMAQFQGLLDGLDIQHLARYIREPQVSAAWPRLQPRTSQLGPVVVGQTVPLSLSLENAGERPLRLHDLQVGGIGRADFQLLEHDCGSELAAGGRCQVRLRHEPRCGLARSAQLVLSHDGPLSPSTVRLLSNGQGAAPAELQWQPQALQFGASLDQELVLQITNACGDQLSVQDLRVEGPFERSGSSNCDAARLSSGERCELRLRRRLIEGAPSATQPSNGAVWITSSAAQPQRVSLGAVALAPAALRWTPNNAVIAPREGQAFSIDAGELRNEGTAVLQLQDLRSSHPAIALESADACRDGLWLQAGQACVLRLRGAALPAGPSSTTLSLRAAPGAVDLRAELRLQVSAAPAPAPLPEPSPSRGGGSTGPLFLLLLCMAALALRRRPGGA